MNKSLKIVVISLLVVILNTLAGERAYAQFTNSFTLANGQNKVIVKSTVNNSDTLHKNKGFRVVQVSINSNMIPIINEKRDTFYFDKSAKNFSDTLNVSLTDPMNFYVNIFITSEDTLNQRDTALSPPSGIPILVTPKFKKGSMNVAPVITSQNNAIINGTFTSGYDSATVKVVISYGDTIFANPSVLYPFEQKIFAKAGADQNFNLNFNITIGVPNYYFSYKVNVTNSVGDTTSKVLWGKTSASPTSAMVSSPFGITAGYDSVTFSSITVTSNLETRHVAYIGKSAGIATDSIVTIIPSGIDNVTIKNLFKKLSPETNYYIWSCVKNSLNAGAFCSNYALAQSGSTPLIFTLTIDSVKATSSTEQTIFWKSLSPSSANVYIIGKDLETNQTVVLGSAQVGSGKSINSTIYPNLVPGKTYQVTIYGYDVNFTKIYQPWEVSSSFIFVPNIIIVGINKTEKNPISVYPNPTTDHITFSIPENYIGTEIEIYDLSGKIVKVETLMNLQNIINVSNFQKGIYFYKTIFGSGKFIVH